MKHWRLCEYEYSGGTYYETLDGDIVATVHEVGDDSRVNITPKGDSTSSLSSDELKELVTICEAHQS